ncbi:hypothetical protein N7I30_04490 [Aurantimonas litoralis]|nr:hypothetical protein [Aurantimonas litoralis]
MTSKSTIGANASTECNPLTLSIKSDALEKLSLGELKALAGALRTILDVGCGVSGQPRFWKTDMNRNGAGDLVECLNEGIGSVIDDVLTAARKAVPMTGREAEEQAWCILQVRSYYEDELSGIAVDAVQALRDVENAEFNEKHLARTGKAVPA